MARTPTGTHSRLATAGFHISICVTHSTGYVNLPASASSWFTRGRGSANPSYGWFGPRRRRSHLIDQMRKAKASDGREGGERTVSEADPPGAEEEAGGGEEPRDGAPVPALAQVDVPVADPRRRSAAGATVARGRHASRAHTHTPRRTRTTRRID
jgi:hypothetical protein